MASATPGFPQVTSRLHGSGVSMYRASRRGRGKCELCWSVGGLGVCLVSRMHAFHGARLRVHASHVTMHIDRLNDMHALLEKVQL